MHVYASESNTEKPFFAFMLPWKHTNFMLPGAHRFAVCVLCLRVSSRESLFMRPWKHRALSLQASPTNWSRRPGNRFLCAHGVARHIAWLFALNAAAMGLKQPIREGLWLSFKIRWLCAIVAHWRLWPLGWLPRSLVCALRTAHCAWWNSLVFCFYLWFFGIFWILIQVFWNINYYLHTVSPPHSTSSNIFWPLVHAHITGSSTLHSGSSLVRNWKSQLATPNLVQICKPYWSFILLHLIGSIIINNQLMHTLSMNWRWSFSDQFR